MAARQWESISKVKPKSPPEEATTTIGKGSNDEQLALDSFLQSCIATQVAVSIGLDAAEAIVDTNDAERYSSASRMNPLLDP